MIISQMVVLRLLAGAGGVVVTTAQTGWKFLMEFDTFRKQRDEDEKKREQVHQDIEQIQSSVDREIAQLLQQEQIKEAREQELQRLERLVAQNQDFNAANAHNVAKAFARAALQKNFSAVEALEREMDRKIEEDDFLMLALVILD